LLYLLSLNNKHNELILNSIAVTEGRKHAINTHHLAIVI